ncbi:protein takeout-like isoform X1 [Chironomus tepperi]|uniref:protein takeout-like isoform X1 n=1 Tax=Chironomus tepperi TaxID=113505 RepID=UPI00391FC7B8
MNKFVIFAFILIKLICLINAEELYFVEKCYRDDPDIDECLRFSGNKLASYLHEGIPELDLVDVEPVIIDEISISLGDPEDEDAYRATFRNIEAYGVSNITLAKVRSDIDTYQFQLTYEIPRIRVRSNFESSGVLLLIKASGNGDYWGDYENVKCKVYFKGLPYQKVNDDRTYLSVETVKMDFSVRDITMGVENDGNNKVIQAAMNLFINSNAQELLKEMKPALKQKLTILLHNFMENLFSKIPFDEWVE